MAAVRALTRRAVCAIDTTVVAKGLSAAAAPGASYKLPDLPYDYGALEPVISGDIMRLHHAKHHQTYVNGLNATMEKLQAAEDANDVAAAIALQSALKFHGGGHVNHSIFWTNLAPVGRGGGEAPAGPLAKAIEGEFGGLEAFIGKFNAKTAAVQGSGWGWLAMNKETKKLSIETCANQDPLSMSGLVPLLGVDVWEHAYYLQYKNDRAGYLKEIWKVVNWANVAERFGSATA